MASIDITTQSGAVGNGDLQLQNGAPMDGTLRFVTDAVNTASPLKLSTSLVQTTSTLQITTNDNPYIDAEDGAGNNRFTVGRATSSQQVNVDFASNPTGSTTAVGAIRTYRDNVNLSEAMTFIEDGSVGIGTTAPVGILDLYKAAAATRLAIRGDAGQNRLISYRTGAVQRFGLYVNNTAESGANAGSNFAIRAYSDAGTLLSTPLFIERSTGNVGINTTTPDSTFDSNGLVTISGGEALTYGLKALQLPTGIATNVISAGLSTRTGVAGESIIQMGNNLNTLYTGAVNAAKAGAMIRLDTRGVEPNINTSNYSVFQIQTRAAGVADPNYTVPVQIGAAPNGSFIIKTDGTGAFGGNVGIGTSSPSTYGANLAVQGSGNGIISIGQSTSFTTLQSNGQDFYINAKGTGNIIFRNGSSDTERMRITDIGYVGIGTSFPQSNLHIITGSTYGAQINTSQIADTTTRLSIGGFVNDAAGGNGSVAIGGSHHHAATAQSDMIFYTHTGSALTEKGRFLAAGGLTFNGDTAAANALDDYEEGTWTMGVSFGGGNTGITTSVNTGSYTKIGRQVTINGYIVLTSKGSSTGIAFLTGLPFTVGNTSSNFGGATLWFNNITFLNQFQGRFNQNQNYIELEEITNLGVASNLTDADFANNSAIMVSATYFV